MAAKFYIKKGAKETSIPSTPVEGTIYIAKDTGKMYLDYDSSTRLTLNAGAADKLSNTAYINGVGFNGEQNVSFYGKCTTAAGTAAKTTTIDNFSLEDGVTIHVKFTNSNSVEKPTLNVSGTGAKYICRYGTTKADTSSTTTGWRAGAIVTLTYDGDNDVWVRDFWENTTYSIPVGYCSTAAATAAKTASCSNYTLTAKTYLHILIRYANSVQDALTLNVNSKGAKPIYINDAVSSSNNYTLPAGTYIVYYDGTNFYFRTDGILPGNIKKATQLATSRSISLTGDATGSGSFNGTANVSIATTLADTEITAGNYGQSANATANPANTFNIPYITFDSKGRATSASNKIITMPGSFDIIYDRDNSNAKYLARFFDADGTTMHHYIAGHNTADAIIINPKYDGTSDFWDTKYGLYITGSSLSFNNKKVLLGSTSSDYIQGLSISGTTITYTKGDGSTGTLTTQDNNTENTAGATNTSSKIFLIGATAQTANPQTYSHDTVYVNTDGTLWSNGYQVVNLGSNQTLSNKTIAGANISGHLYFTGAAANSSTGSTSQIVFGTSDNNHVAISSNTNALVINPNTSETTNQIVLYLDKSSLFPSGITANLTGNASTATKLATARTINGMNFDGSANINNYGVCATAADTAAKTVTVGSTFTLAAGAQVTVKFTYANSAATPTLNVNNTGAKSIMRYGTTAISTGTTTSGWQAGAVMTFTYDGTNWIRDYWYNTTYTVDQVKQTVITTNGDFPLLLRGTSAGTTTTTTTTSFAAGILANPSTGNITATSFTGNLIGNADTATKLGTTTVGGTAQPIYLNAGTATPISDTVGSTTQPTYLNAGVITVCSTYAGGTKVTLNGTEKGASTVSFYAPTGAGTSGQYLKSSGSGAPTWATTTVSNTWTAGTTAGPTISTTVNGVTGTAVAIPSASSSASGIITTGSQTMAGAKTWSDAATFSSKITANSTLTVASTATFNGSVSVASTATFNGSVSVAGGALTTKAGIEIFHATPYIDFHFNNSTDDYTSRIIETSAGVLSSTAKFYGAVWNDYAEFRICKENFELGQVVFENGDDTVSVSTKRLQRGCSITSDTFGFAIGETDEAKCPIAVSGRVLAYPCESKEEFAKHIGWPVCSGPNGTVSIMTEEEEEKYPSRIIGTISAIPDYDVWGSGNIKVNNRVWIKIK